MIAAAPTRPLNFFERWCVLILILALRPWALLAPLSYYTIVIFQEGLVLAFEGG